MTQDPPGPPIVFIERFAPTPDALLERLLSTVVWDQRMKARKTASFGVPYNFSGMTYPAQPLTPELSALSDLIEGTLAFRPNNCLLNLYPDGRSTMGYHSDATEELEDETGVAIVSLGAPRDIVYKLKADRSVRATIPLPSGSLLYMDGEVQRDWLHGIPKAPGVVSERISCTFRRLIAPTTGPG